ncbi:Protein of unknown function [Streptomyces sp. WMMB 714]|uniref:DUF2470 domain-containing protein n=1 Tax=Streptomyces sp. WMMB 714 TaxID=1286822 RepID=UPI0008239C1E|nr:DUF2470 domain-containing protein [Streptomyces sp. WMMB 714]SCK07596.1 Protein of unknown function [Streptomyces sp. WMMB 714]
MFRPGIPLPGSDAGREQPRPVEDAAAPTAAERVRTLVESSVSAALDIPSIRSQQDAPPGSGSPEARAVTPDGDVVLLVPAASPAAQLVEHAAGDEVTAVMEITDIAPVAVPHRVRGRAWIAGWLTPVRSKQRAACERLVADRHPAGPTPSDPAWTLLRLEVGEAFVDDLWGAEQVEPDDFAAAAPDPLAPHEAELLQHLAASHSEQMRGLCALLGDREAACAAAGGCAVPLSVDRFGMRVRFCGLEGFRNDAYFDARFEFPDPVGGVAQLRQAMRLLFETAAERPGSQ